MEEPTEDLALPNWEASFTTKRREKWGIEEIQVVGMSPPPLGPHNHSQNHLKLLGWLPLQAPVSAGLRTTKSLELSGTWTFLSLEISKHAKASRIAHSSLHLIESNLSQSIFFLKIRYSYHQRTNSQNKKITKMNFIYLIKMFFICTTKKSNMSSSLNNLIIYQLCYMSNSITI